MTHTVRNAAEARKLRASARDPKNVNALSPGHQPPKRLHYDRSVDLQVADAEGLSVDPSEFTAALKAIQALCDDFKKHAYEAANLATRLHDGFGPVADVVGNAFEHRLGPSGGVGFVTSTGSDHFDEIANTLQDIINSYLQGEEDAWDAMSQAGKVSQ